MTAEELDQNPASDLDVVALPRPPVGHNPFLRMDELPALLVALRGYGGASQTRLGLRLLLLAGVRTGELRLATPDQFDLERRLWIIPPEVVKQLQMGMRKAGKQTSNIPPSLAKYRAAFLRNTFHRQQRKSKLRSTPMEALNDALSVLLLVVVCAWILIGHAEPHGIVEQDGNFPCGGSDRFRLADAG